MADGVPFGNYRLQRRLARGGMAEVFLARLIGVEGFERRVAIKRILPHLSQSEEFRGMFLDEARLAAQLTHPNIVHIYDFGKVDDYYFIAMEYVDGVDLGRMIRRARERAVPFELCARILADVCAGLEFAHNAVDAMGRALNLVHRDVSPQNVLVTYDGTVKLVDFGIAKAAFAVERTRPGVVKGKYAYMSPEQVEGRNLDGRSDVFSAGICLYELVTGQPLYRRDNMLASMREISDGKPIRPDKYRSNVPEALVSIMRRALQRSREGRYASAAAMQLDLEKFLKGAAALATAREVGEFVRRELPRPSDDGVAGPSTPSGQRTPPQTQGTPPQAQGTPPQATPPEVTPPTPVRDLAAELPDEGDVFTVADATEDVPTRESDDDLIATRAHEEAPTRPLPGPPTPTPTPTGKSTRTAVVAPLAPSPLRTVVAAVAAAITVAGVILLALRPWTRSREPVIVRVPASATPTPAPAHPSPSAPVASAANSPAPNPANLPPPSATSPPRPTPTPRKPAAPMLDILSRPPGAHVTVDGEQLRAATPIHAEAFAPGLHKVSVEKKGYLPRQLAVQLGDGEHRTLDVELRAAARVIGRAPQPRGLLTVRTLPWSKVFDGARLLGTTPLANVPLAAGTHTLTFVNPDFPPLTRTVQVRAGEESRLSLELKK
jgi:serine/threonine-protein kinase